MLSGACSKQLDVFYFPGFQHVFLQENLGKPGQNHAVILAAATSSASKVVLDGIPTQVQRRVAADLMDWSWLDSERPS